MAPAVTRLVCQFPNCNWVFKNKSGLTQHTHAQYGTLQNLNHIAPLVGPGFILPQSHSPTPAGVIDENFHQDPAGDQDFVLEEGNWVDMGRLFYTFHLHLTGLKCDANGAFIDQDAPPPPHTDALPTDWMPYDNCAEFETAEFLFTCNQMSAKQIDTLLDLWATTLIKHNDAPPFANHRNMYTTIDATPLGDTPWKSFMLCYNRAKPEQDIPPWMDGQYDVWYRDPLQMMHSILAKCAFDGGIEYSPYHDYTTEDKQYFKNFMSGDWVWKQADDIARNEENQGSTFVPLIIGSDKTVVSVATGQTKYHPLYLSIGNIHNSAWDEYGIIADLIPFTNDFPRVDIHELLSPDILHQIIKGTFKDHLVDWVGEYLLITHSTHHAAEIMNDIDRRIAAWTGDDLKALMKVYLAAIEGHVPQDVVLTFSAFLEFCYTVRCEALTEDDLIKLQDALNRFHQYREIFKTTAARVDFEARGMLRGSCLSNALGELWRRQNIPADDDLESLADMAQEGHPGHLHIHKPQNHSVEVDAGEIIDGPAVESHVGLALTPHIVHALSLKLDLPHLPFMIQEFIHDEHYSKDPNPPEFDPATVQVFLGNLTVFNSAAALFHAPSDLSDTGGMRCKHIRATPSWCVGELRHDCIFVNMGVDFNSPMNGLTVAQVLCFFSFNYRILYYPCTIVHWYSYVHEERDPDTGMYVVMPMTTGDDVPDIAIIHINCIFRAAHLIPVYGLDFIPKISPHNSYDMFDLYYVNRYADHHAF
ncbi:uncharacterized protein EDB93DRAFT_1257087 [Suillus bovinus]|uniref:uncharacterized protein n=1 Tax=Suillus bovinus TaxID=48563 RepID=UPI001B88476A|nr:uncharacterized protein EDB93DRAFT_1257087 [Suillus bovinus]KAG2127265.1 hypothetical protein EDB93DRAFT_1257087 [Suillus bovinus]